jgi:hypothetical protein
VQSLVEIGSVVSSEKIFKKYHPPFFYFELGGHLGWKLGSPDTFGLLEQNWVGMLIGLAP